ncbi:MAG TPA: hypothetical protein VFN67_21570 [Polyangiales bacterium]|nr:hypothetical protein [Polyangiales bacterium]
MTTAVPVLRAPAWLAIAALLLGAAALAAMFWGFHVAPERAYHAYLAGYAFTLSAAIGCIAFVCIAHAANTTWPVAVRRLPEAVAPALPVLALLFLPILLGVPALYPWARPAAYPARVRELLEHRQAFMNVPFFAVRAGIYLTIWSAIALALRQLSLAMEHGVDAQRCARRLRRLSYAALPILALTAAASAFEWLMSLSPEFSSTMFGANWIALCLFGGVASTIVLTGLIQRSRTPLPAPGPSHYSALGRLLLAFLVFLAYTEFFQYLLGWIGNRPSEAEWFLERGRGAYYASVMFLIFGHFTVPFVVLLSYAWKRRIRVLTWVGGFCLFSLYVHVHWLITPAAHRQAYSVFDLIAVVAVLGLCSSVCLWAQQGKALAAVSDPRYAETCNYQSR